MPNRKAKRKLYDFRKKQAGLYHVLTVPFGMHKQIKPDDHVTSNVPANNWQDKAIPACDSMV